MIKFLLIILFFVFVIPYLLGVIGRLLLGKRPHQSASSQRSGNNNSSSDAQRNPKKKKKVFEKNEGEYIDYVEIKEKK